MSVSNQFAVYLPFLLGAFLLAVVIAGSRMSQAGRRKVERFLLLPAFALFSVLAVYAAARQHRWWEAIFLAFMAGWIASTLYHRAVAERNRSGQSGVRP